MEIRPVTPSKLPHLKKVRIVYDEMYRLQIKMHFNRIQYSFD